VPPSGLGWVSGVIAEPAPPSPAAATQDDLPLRDDLRGLTPYGAPQVDAAVRLNTNESSYGVPEDVALAVVRAVAGQTPGLNRYPDREFTELREELAGYLGHGVTANQVWAANGSNEVLLHLLQAFGGPGRTALGFTPGYAMHPIISRTTGTGWVDGWRGASADHFALDAATVVDQIGRHRPDLVFLCSPNNPTGTALAPGVVEAACAAAEKAVVVVDEAYAEFVRAEASTSLGLLPSRPRLVVTRTMSKAFALAGVRLGYLAADPAVGDALRLVRLPYHLSSLTQAAATAALRHRDQLLLTVSSLRHERDRLVDRLTRMGLRPVPSDANFVLFGGLDDERAIWQALLEAGVLVRDVGIPHHLRVSAGTPNETDTFLSALSRILGTGQTSTTDPEQP
jgi:histidinol-phosphate aminotransferase